MRGSTDIVAPRTFTPIPATAKLGVVVFSVVEPVVGCSNTSPKSTVGDAPEKAIANDPGDTVTPCVAVMVGVVPAICELTVAG